MTYIFKFNFFLLLYHDVQLKKRSVVQVQNLPSTLCVCVCNCVVYRIFYMVMTSCDDKKISKEGESLVWYVLTKLNIQKLIGSTTVCIIV